MLEKFVFECRDMRSFIDDICISISKIKLNDYFLEKALFSTMKMKVRVPIRFNDRVPTAGFEEFKIS